MTVSGPLQVSDTGEVWLDSTAVAVTSATDVGGGVLALAGVAFATTGPSTIIAFLLNGGIAMLTALSFAALAARFPQSGGTYTYARKVLTVEAAFAEVAIILAGDVRRSIVLVDQHQLFAGRRVGHDPVVQRPIVRVIDRALIVLHGPSMPQCTQGRERAVTPPGEPGRAG